MTLFSRVGRCATAFLVLVQAGPFLWADETNAPAAVTPPAPYIETRPKNPATAPFLQSHPDLAQPFSTNQPSLSLHPDTSADQPAPPPPVPAMESKPGEQAANLPDHLLVVYNQNDPDSKSLAQYYADRRHIPPERVLAIACPVTEEVSRADYEKTIREPISDYLMNKGWLARHVERAQIGGSFKQVLVATKNDIWAIVLMRGVPLKIANDPGDLSAMEGQQMLSTNSAAVDNELALLPVFGLPRGGFLPNIFFDSRGVNQRRVGPDLARSMILVTRLDGPAVADVRRMIDDSLYAEQNRLAGLAVIDTRGITDNKDQYWIGDVWLCNARDILAQDGWLVKFDAKEYVIEPTDPCNHVAIYLGWYRDSAYGPWNTPPDRFVRGAVAYHLHSFSAVSLRSTTEGWAGPFIAHGVAATMGTVYEPILSLTPHEDIFIKHLLDGQYFCEAAYASQMGLSWMTTVVGDPLYRPFLKPIDAALANVDDARSGHADWLRLQLLQRQLVAGTVENSAASLVRYLDDPAFGQVADEGLGDILSQMKDPLAAGLSEPAYRKALTGEVIPIDRIRLGLKLGQYYETHGQSARAQAEYKVLRQLYPLYAKQFAVPGPPDAAPPSTTASSSSSGRGGSTLPEPPKPPKPQPYP